MNILFTASIIGPGRKDGHRILYTWTGLNVPCLLLRLAGREARSEIGAVSWEGSLN